MFHHDFAFIMAPITKLLWKIEAYEWTPKCQVTWEAIKQRYIEVPIFIVPRWDLEFRVHTDASNLVVNAMLTQNPTSKCNQPIAYAS
jgi:hypothetical protein